MIELLNAFLLLLLAAAALLGMSALVQKRTMHRSAPAPASTRGSNHLP